LNFNFSIEKDFRKILYLIFFHAIIIELSVIANGFYSVSADDSDRTIVAYNLLNGKLPSDYDWLPLHTLILSGTLAINSDLFWAPRVISILFGLFSLAAIILLSHTIFSNKKITILTALYAIIFPFRIIFSAVPLSEIVFAFFITMAFAFFIKWLKQSSTKYLYLSALFFTLSSSVRYEGWIFALSYFFVILYFFIRKRVNAYSLIHSSLILASVPLLWLVFHTIVNGNPFAFFQGPYGLYNKLVGDSLILRLKYNFLTHFIFQNLFFLTFLGLITVVILSKKDNVIKSFVVLWFIAFFIMSVASLSGYGNPSHAFWRIPFIWNYLLIPFLAYMLFYFSEKKIFTGKVRWGIILLPIPLFYLIQTILLSNGSHFSREDKAAGEYLSSIIVQNPGTKILLDTSEWNYLHLQVASGHPENFIFNSGHDPGKPINPIIDEGYMNMSTLETLKIKYLILQNPSIKRTVSKEGGFIKIRSFGNWELYQTDY
jgi:hypothetical protein